MRNRSKLLPIVLALPFVVVGCGGEASPSEATTRTVTSTVPSVGHGEGTDHSNNEQPHHGSDQPHRDSDQPHHDSDQPHHNEGVVRDDDPGGHPCTDQSGAPGHYIPTDEGSFVCEITGDAPQH